MSARARIPAVLALCLGCVASPPQAPSEQAEAEPRPSRRLVRVTEAAPVGLYLDATLQRDDEVWRLFFPRSGDCEALLTPGAEVRYAPQGPFGRVVGEDRAWCEPVGLGSLLRARDDQPRRRSQYLMPRELAAFRDVAEGERNFLVRGRFPLAIEIRWPEPMDSVAWLPAIPECRAVLEYDSATMEFYAEGPVVFALEAEDGTTCPIEGLAIPLEVE